MKKLISLMLFLVMAVLIGCGGSAPAVEVTDDLDLGTLPDLLDVTTVSTLQERDDVILIDVREQWEYDEGHIPGITHIPLGEVAARIDEIPTDKTVILTCRSGNRSGQAFNFLSENGYDSVHNMQGGIIAWQAAGLPVEQ